MNATNETFVSGFFNSVDDDRTYNAVHWANYFGALVSDGVFPNPSTNMQVLEHIGMKVKISKGMAWIKAYFAHNMADYVLALEPADGTLKRIDRIVLRLDLNSRLITPEVLKGRFAASPVAPSLVRNDEVHDIALADIYVTNGTTSINQGMITDHRLNKDLCGLVHALINQVDTTTIFNQYQSWFNDYSVTKAAEFLAWQTSVTTALETWIDAQQADFVAWRKAEEQLYYTWLEARKNGFDSWFATIQDILDTNAAGNLQNQIDAHKDASRPHNYLDTSDNQVYEYGLQRNPTLNAAAFVYAKEGEQQANVINLPTYEQVAGIEKTSGAVMGADGGRYLANFDDSILTSKLVRNDNMEKFHSSFNSVLQPESVGLDITKINVYFIYLNEKFRLSYGTVSKNGVGKLWYAITNADTFEVVAGQIIDTDSDHISVYDFSTTKDIAITSRYIWIRVAKAAGMAVALIDINTFEFKKFFTFSTTIYTAVLGLAVTEDGSLAMINNVSTNNVLVVVWKLTLDVNKLPTGGTNTIYNMSLPAIWQGNSIFSDGEFIYTGTTPSGTQYKCHKIKFDRITNQFTEVATFTNSNAPNPVPNEVFQYITTLNDGTKVLIRYYGTNATNGSYLTVTKLDTFTNLFATQIGGFGTSPIFDAEGVVFKGGNGDNAALIGNAYYMPISEMTLNRETGTFANKFHYILSNMPTSVGGNPTPKVNPIGTGIKNKNGVYVSQSNSARFQSMERVYNLINYSKEV